MQKRMVAFVLLLGLLLAPGGAWAYTEDEPLRVLILGIDSQDETTRSDTLLILQVSPDAGEVRMASIARDTYVYLPHKGFSDRINTAYRYGNAQTALDTVNASFGLQLDTYVVVHYEGFEVVVDAIGGVDLQLDITEVNTIAAATGEKPILNIDFSHHLNGKQALAYVRIRILDNDFGRGGRQRALLLATAQKLQTQWSVELFTSLLTSLLIHIETNIEITEALTLMGAFSGDAGAQVRFEELGMPVQGQFSYADVNGKSVVVLTERQWEENRRLLEEFLGSGQ